VILDGVVVFGVNVTLHDPAVKLQVVADKVPAPPVAAKVTVPVGTDVVPGEASATVAVQVDA